MTLDEFFGIGIVTDLGSYTFSPDEIVAFAQNYDPQPRHLGKDRNGAPITPCASNWHVAAVWMKLSLAAGMTASDRAWNGPGPRPVFGPSPGFRSMRWLEPAKAGEPIAFSRTILAHRALASRPGWRILTVRGQADRPAGGRILDFDSGVMVQAA